MKVYIRLLSVLLVACIFSSCANTDEYIIDYPESYTLDYCIDNYVEADPNLIYLRAADNIIGKMEIPGGFASFRAIKDVALDEYLLRDEAVLYRYISYQIVKNKNNIQLPEQEILSYDLESIIIYSPKSLRDIYLDQLKLGTEIISEILISTDSEGVAAFQNHIIDCIETNNYRQDIQGNIDDFRARVVFKNYESLAWDTRLREQNGTYYIDFYIPADGDWTLVYLPINQELVDLIQE